MSSNPAISHRVHQLVADIFGVPLAAVTPGMSHHDVADWDSLNIVKLAMAVEAEFGVPITPDDAVEFTSVGAIIDTLTRKTQQR
jgi:acyl carrier protein